MSELADKFKKEWEKDWPLLAVTLGGIAAGAAAYEILRRLKKEHDQKKLADANSSVAFIAEAADELGSRVVPVVDQIVASEPDGPRKDALLALKTSALQAKRR